MLANVSFASTTQTDITEIKQYQLIDHPLAQSEYGRKALNYLISCALPDNTIVSTTVNNQTIEFKGAIGLAPNWVFRGLSEEEQYKVSACMLARTNYFGVPVNLSMRAEHLSKALGVTEKEKQSHSIYEGAFFGNLFSENPVAYACVGKKSDWQKRDLILNLRVCTTDSGKRTIDDRTVSYCDFIITGPCDDPKSFTVDGHTYTEVIHVYLEPTGAQQQIH